MAKLIMPKMEPVSIPTKNKCWLAAVFTWMFTTRRWRVTEKWTFTLHDGTEIMIPYGFVFDGASIPKPSGGAILILAGCIMFQLGFDWAYLPWILAGLGELMILAGLLLSPVGILLIPGLIHDFAYQMNCLWCTDGDYYHLDASRSFWDRLFKDTAIQINGFKVINRGAWVALILFGWWPWWGHRKKDYMRERYER